MGDLLEDEGGRVGGGGPSSAALSASFCWELSLQQQREVDRAANPPPSGGFLIFLQQLSRPSRACSEGLGARPPQASEGGFVLPPGGDSPAHAGCKLHFAVFLSWMHLKADGSLYSLAVSGRTGKKGTA